MNAPILSSASLSPSRRAWLRFKRNRLGYWSLLTFCALVLLSLLSSLTAPIGARLAHKLPVATLKKVFAGLLIALSAKMLHTVLGG